MSLKIIHACLSNYYVDNFGYQENQLVKAHIEQGHIVKVIASCETLGADNKEKYVSEVEYIGGDGAFVKRIAYRFGNNFFSRKIRAYKNFNVELNKFKPDIILFHGASSWELINCMRYKKNNPKVKFYVDMHSDLNNSGRNFFSKYILHGIYYRLIVSRILNVVDKFLCVSMDVIDFAKDIYKIPAEKIEFYPLGGNVISDQELAFIRERFRAKNSISNFEIVLGQFGKLSKSKKIIEVIKAFLKTNTNLRLVIGGSIDESISNEFFDLIASDKRVLYLGWLNQDELKEALCGIDVYIQPGSQSAIMQNALCYGRALILANVKAHTPYIKGNGWLVDPDVSSLLNVFNCINDQKILDMKIKSKEIQFDFDYKSKLASRVLK
jgi:1,2-diacylglycerol 3-alpha-glucosyltransferase